MAGRRRHDQISDYHLDKIERQIAQLQFALAEASRALTPFRDDYNAITELEGHLRVALNVLNGRPADYEQPHAAPMSGR